MAWYPKAIRKEIPPGANDPAITPVGIIYHVRAGEGDSLYPYFSGPSGGIESHWYIRYDGTVEQYRSTTREADANLDGNSWLRGGSLVGLLSVETEGLEFGDWTTAQIQALKDVTVWASQAHGFPLQVIPRWDGDGVGYHVMFGAPGPYTSVVGKTCPGPNRVEQFKRIIVPWLESGGGMSWSEEFPPQSDYERNIIPDGWSDTIYRYVIKAAGALAWLKEHQFSKPFWPDEKITLTNAVRWMHSRSRKAEPQIDTIEERTAVILDKLNGADTQQILDRIDQRHAEAAAQRQANADKLDAVLDLLDQHADGSLDADAVVDGVRDLLHQATAPQDDSLDDG